MVLVLMLAGCVVEPERVPIDSDIIEDVRCDAVDSGGPTPSHDSDVLPIWETSCYPCHSRRMRHGELLLEGSEQVVDVPSSDVPQMDLVEPGSLEQSYLWHKIVGTHRDVGGDGTRMPKEGVGLSDEDAQTICRWIESGASR